LSSILISATKRERPALPVIVLSASTAGPGASGNPPRGRTQRPGHNRFCRDCCGLRKNGGYARRLTGLKFFVQNAVPVISRDELIHLLGYNCFSQTICPLQYQKQLRLVAARERMLVEGLDAASATFEVGYESASQFNREYKRFFGQPPMRDIKVRRLASSAIVSD
jgi:hypothetical protein